MFSLRIKLAARVAAGLLALPAAQAANYYVSPSGSESAPGTLAQPFQTIQRAAAVMVAGDTAYIRAGVYRETVKPVNSGTQAAPITFMPYNGEAVTVSGADVIPANSWTPYRGNIYQAPMAWSLVTGPDQYPIGNQIFLDSQMMIEARWPNTALDVSHPTPAFAAGGTYVDGGSGLSTGTLPTRTCRPGRQAIGTERPFTPAWGPAGCGKLALL